MQEAEADDSLSNLWSACSRQVRITSRPKRGEKRETDPSYRLFPVVEPTPPTSDTPVVSSKVCHSLMALPESMWYEKQQSTSVESSVCRPQTSSDATMTDEEVCSSKNALPRNPSSSCACIPEEARPSSSAQSVPFPERTRVTRACVRKHNKRVFPDETSVCIEDRLYTKSAASGSHSIDVVSNAKQLLDAGEATGERRTTETVSTEALDSRTSKWSTRVKRLQALGMFMTSRQPAGRKAMSVLSSSRPESAPHEGTASNKPGVPESFAQAHAENKLGVPKSLVEVIPASDKSPGSPQSVVPTLIDLIVQRQTLHEEYLTLRAERTKLLDSMNLVLRQTKPQTAQGAMLLDRVLSLSMLAISVDVCFYRMKTMYFRQDAAVEELLSRIKLGEVGITG